MSNQSQSDQPAPSGQTDNSKPPHLEQRHHAFNKNEQVKRLRTYGDKLADKVTKIAGSTPFLALNLLWFAAWILVNTGTFGDHLIFDAYPFGFLTVVVSLEAIVLSVFVLITQNRSSKRSEIHAELDYLTDLKASAENTTIISILERLSAQQNIPVGDLLEELAATQRRIGREHPVAKADLD
jgi:uncharacterized membrane protein